MSSNTIFSRFTSSLRVRPDDIDMFQHIHNSKYFDYVLAARYEQMETAYRMSMEDFIQQGYGWVVKTAHVNFIRPLTLGESFKVTTGLVSINEKGSRVSFEIISDKSNKLNSDGWFDYVLIDINTGRSKPITQEMIEKYSI